MVKTSIVKIAGTSRLVGYRSKEGTTERRFETADINWISMLHFTFTIRTAISRVILYALLTMVYLSGAVNLLYAEDFYRGESTDTFELIGILDSSEIARVELKEDAFLVVLPLCNKETGETEVSKSRPSLVFKLSGLSPDEKRLLNDSNDGQWDTVSPLDATLIAEGHTSPEARQSYNDKMETFRSELDRALSGVQDPIRRIRIIFEYMHRRVLTNRYDLNRSSVALALDTGIYNCVSATILFNCLATEAGMNVSGLETTGHAKSRVLLGESYLDIETTCTQWRLLPDRLERSVQAYRAARPVTSSTNTEALPLSTVKNRRSGEERSGNGIAHSKGNPPQAADSNGMTYSGNRRMREINFVQLTATVYYNRGVDFSQSGKYGKALGAYIKAIHLDPANTTILGNLKATMNNWAIELATTRKNFPESIRITECGLALDPHFEQLSTNLPIFYQHWISELRKEQRKEEADYLEKEYRKKFALNTP